MKDLLLVAIGVFAGILNTLAGGGSLITLPILIFLGLPPQVANGTNRIYILIQNIFGSAGFQSKGVHTFPFNIYMGIAALFGAVIGAQIAVEIDDQLFNRILAIIMLVVIFYTIFNRKTKLNIQARIHGKYFWWSIISFFFIGIYGGFIQAGTGFLILFSLSAINRLDLIKSNAVKTIVILIYTLSALATFIYYGKVNWLYGLELALGGAIGAWLSSRWIVGKSDRIIKILLVIVVIAMAVKLWV